MSSFDLVAGEWLFTALLAFGAAAILKFFKLAPLWALAIGMLVFTGLQFPIQTHAVMLDMPTPTKPN